ncbi:MAG: hypothetical protein JNM17_02555, partial [Archangium sp.]|nr:hypothetical protein [Archangium sp.]
MTRAQKSPRGAGQGEGARTVFSLVLAFTFAACTQTTASTSAGLIGTHDLVFVDQLADDGTLAKVTSDTDGNLVANGVPSRFLFVTSADTNELRVLEMFRPNTTGRDFMRGPNPLETLSIPVLDRPTMLATGEGRNDIGQRATSQYVFAARPGGAEVSVVSVALRRQLGGRPLSLPAPVTAISASMAVTADQKPGSTTLYVSTWDGETSSIFVTDLDPDTSVADAAVRDATQKFRRLTTIDAHPMAALMVIAPLATRTVDGSPFCDTQPCLALASRVNTAGKGDSWLFEPGTGRTAKLGFPGPVRKFAAGTITRRLYAILDEAECGGPQCGGVVAVDLITGASLTGFPQARDVIGRAFGPLRVTEGLLTGLSIAQGAVVAQLVDTVDDAGASDIAGVSQQYDELGAFASSDGLITWFSGNAGSVLDYDMRRAIVKFANLRAPGLAPDGGFTLTTPDGGFAGAFIEATVDAPSALSQTFRRTSISVTGALPSEWSVDVSDGYFLSQEFLIINEGQIPGLVYLDATSVAGGSTTLNTQGYESRALVGDTVVFFTGSFSTSDVYECGRAKVAAINTGSINVDAVPCTNATLFVVRASGLKPWMVVGSVDGYMGRSAPGEQFTYSKPLILIPADVIAERTAMTINMATGGLQGEGSYLAFALTAYITPLRVSIDSTAPGLTKCSS